MRNGVFAGEPEGEFRCAEDPSLREEERFGRDDAGRVCALVFIDLASGFTTWSLHLFHGGQRFLLALIRLQGFLAEAESLRSDFYEFVVSDEFDGLF